MKNAISLLGIVALLLIPLVSADSTESYYAYGDGTYAMEVGDAIQTNTQFVVKLTELSSYSNDPMQFHVTFEIYNPSNELVDTLGGVFGPGTTFFNEYVRLEISDIAVNDDGPTKLIVSIISLPTATSIVSIVPTVTPVGDLHCKNFNNDGTHALCVGYSITANNGIQVKVLDISGYGYYEDGSQRNYPRVTYGVELNGVGQSIQLEQGESQTLRFDNGKAVSIHVPYVSPGAFGQEAYAITTVKSVPKPTLVPPDYRLKVDLDVSTDGSTATFKAVLNRLTVNRITSNSGQEDIAMPHPAYNVYLSYAREGQSSSVLIPMRFNGAYYEHTAYRLDDGFYTAEASVKYNGQSSSDKASFVIRTNTPPLPPQTYEMSLRLAKGWNMISSPYSQSPYYCPAGKACAVENPLPLNVVQVPQSETAMKVTSDQADTTQAKIAPGSSGGGGYGAAIVQTNMPTLIQPLPVQFKGGIITESTCSQATLWHYNTQQRRYVKYGVLKEGASVPSGSGYWVKVSDSCSVTIAGNRKETLEGERLFQGWNQIGGPADAVSFSSISQGCNVQSGPWKWNAFSKQYERVSTLVPGEGYFVKVSSACTLGAFEDIPPLPEETKSHETEDAQAAGEEDGYYG
ncbi:hypothetical protein KJ765_06640 [Candidatus Micrarchaeota archaeon]|nr:hypothetical protein [Candidatus Micrarchaeota archaeon]